MRTVAMLTAGLVLGATLLTGCGGGSNTNAYCSLLKNAKDQMTAFSGGSVPTDQQIADFQTQVHNLSAKAPSSLNSDWKLVSDALDSLVSTLKASGIKMSDLANALATGKPPAGASLSDLTALSSKIQALTGADFAKAAQAIEKDAKSSCGVTITLG